MSQQCKQQWTPHSALMHANAQCGVVGGGVADPDGTSLSQKAQDLGAEDGIKAKQYQLDVQRNVHYSQIYSQTHHHRHENGIVQLLYFSVVVFSAHQTRDQLQVNGPFFTDLKEKDFKQFCSHLFNLSGLMSLITWPV